MGLPYTVTESWIYTKVRYIYIGKSSHYILCCLPFVKLCNQTLSLADLISDGRLILHQRKKKNIEISTTNEKAT